MKQTDYYKSGKHRENYIKAAAKARIVQAKQKEARIEEYDSAPALCACCETPLPYENKKNRFCNSSCAAKFNNKNRPARTDESLAKTSSKLKGRTLSPEVYALRSAKMALRPKRMTRTVMHTCKICEKIQEIPFIKRSRTTCGADDCVVQAKVGVRTYQNGSRKPEWYFNKNENKEVLLDSSWEVKVAKSLDAADVEWIRPKFIKWTDVTGKIRRYFPDFYLPKSDIYLDPKNPYCMVRDKEKMEQISKQVRVIFGPVDTVIQEALQLQ